MKIIGQLNESDLKAYNAGNKRIVNNYLKQNILNEKINTKSLKGYKETKNVKICGTCKFFYITENVPFCSNKDNEEELVPFEKDEQVETSPYGYCNNYKKY